MDSPSADPFIDHLDAMKINKQCSVVRNPEHSQLHPIIPRLCVMEWKTDMPNRNLIIKNAELGGVPHYEHDENLYLEKREQMKYNVEDRSRVDSKYRLPSRSKLLRPKFHHPTSRYQSSLMSRRDALPQ
ncbi:sperm-associated microtubule inner protein 10-like [Tubulanus polymorphus]|uniref:sperm-associated microtubule inner protein 10-like n=1 Tax=Tubulanus polymorphus TaxID=672921 RepID=UPI003DA5388D